MLLEMDQLAEAITQPWMVDVFVAIILLVALRPLYQAIFSISKVNADLNKAIKVLQSLGHEHRKREFCVQFKEINSQISRIPGLRQAWRELVDSMYFENAAPTNKKIYLSHNPSYAFNRDSILGKQLNLAQFLAYPNYLIGLGLTFTFIGLAAALHVAQAGLASGAGQQALKDLLAVASVKFISSIAGIASSLVISYFQRIRLRKFQQRLNIFCELLEDSTEYKPTEKLLYAGLLEQRRHSAALTDMAANIAGGIGEVLSRQLPASVAQALDPLSQEMRGLARQFSGSLEGALKNVLDEFLAQLRQRSLDDIQGIIDSAGILKESLDALVANVEQVGKSFDSVTTQSASRLTNAFEQCTASFAPVQSAINQFGQSIAALEAAAATIGQAGGSIGGAAEDNRKSAAELGKAAAEMTAGLAPMKELLNNLSQAFGKVQDTATDLKAAGGNMNVAADGLKQSAALIEQAESRFSQKAQVFESLAQGVSAAVASLEKASGQIGDASRPLGDVSANLTQALQVMRETETKVQTNQQELNAILANLQKSTETIAGLWQQYEERFGKVDGDLGKAFGELARGSEQFRSGIEAFVSLIDTQFSKTISGLSGAIRELAETSNLQRKDSGYFAKLKSKWSK